VLAASFEQLAAGGEMRKLAVAEAPPVIVVRFNGKVTGSGVPSSAAAAAAAAAAALDAARRRAGGSDDKDDDADPDGFESLTQAGFVCWFFLAGSVGVHGAAEGCCFCGCG
jgi:hypothetical protein